jgi:hypothetical protein
MFAAVILSSGFFLIRLSINEMASFERVEGYTMDSF